MDDRKYELGHEHVGRLLVRYSTPAVIAMFVNSLYNLVDTIFVGRGAGTYALAGLAVSFPIQMFFLAAAQVVGMGAASIISRSLGAGDHRKAERAAGTSFATSACMAFLLGGFGLAFLNPVLRLFGATPQVLPYAAQYLSIIMGGSVFFCFAVSSHNVVRSEGNVKAAMASMIIGAVVNVILDPLFIFTFGLGIRGAAIATVIAQFCSFVYLVHYFLSGKSMLRIRRLDLIPDLSLLPEIFAVGSAAFARVAAGSIVAIILNNAATHYGSDLYLAVIGVVNRVMMFMMMPLFGLVQGLQPIVGFNYGARNMDRVKRAVTIAAAYASCHTLAAFLFLMVCPQVIIALFSKDPELIEKGSHVTRVMVLCLPLVGFQIVGASMFQALGKAMPSLFLSMSRQILFLVPLLLALPMWFGLSGVWVSFPLADSLSCVVTALWVAYQMRELDRQAVASTP